MSTGPEDLRILGLAESVADEIWPMTLRWDKYAKDTLGRQLCRAADSIGANIAEAFGRYHYGEKIRFLYYARGSLFETKYWLNRAHVRHLTSADANNSYANRLNHLGRQLNQYVNHLKAQQRKTSAGNALRESSQPYQTTAQIDEGGFLTPGDLDWLASPNPQSLIPNP